MNPQPTPEEVEAANKDQIKEYRKLQDVANDEAFTTFFDLQLKIAAEKMLRCFTTSVTYGKDEKGKKVPLEVKDNIQNWDDFCKARGEILARLHPIQEIYSAEHMIKYLEQSLQGYKQQG